MHKIKDFYKAYIKAIKEINSEREEGEVWLSLLKTLTYEKKDIVDAFDNVGKNLNGISKYFSKEDYEKYVVHVLKMTTVNYSSEHVAYSEIIHKIYAKLLSYYNEAISLMKAYKYSEIKNVYKDAITYVCEQEHIHNIENLTDSLRYQSVFDKKYVYSNYGSYHDKNGINVKVRVFFSDFSDPKIIYDMFLEELETLKLIKAKFDQNIEVNEPDTGKTKPRAPKKKIEPSQKEKLKIAQSALSDILKNTSENIISFLEKKSLLEEFKTSFIDEYSKQSFVVISVSAKIMTGDANSSRYDDFDITFDEFDYIKEWWNEYIKVYPVEEYSDNDIYRVGYEEVGIGAWNIDAINQLLKDKTVKVFTFDHGYSTVKMNVSKDISVKFENKYESITDKPDPNAYYNALPDMLLAYATYWHTMGEKSEYLVRLSICL